MIAAVLAGAMSPLERFLERVLEGLPEVPKKIGEHVAFERAEKILRPVLGQVWDFAVDCIKRSLAFLYDGSAAIYHLIAQRPEILLGLGIAVLLLGGVYPMMFSDDDSKKVSLKSPALKRKGVSSLSALQVAGLLISAGAIVMLIRHPHA